MERRDTSATPLEPTWRTGGITRRNDSPPDRSTAYEKLQFGSPSRRVFAGFSEPGCWYSTVCVALGMCVDSPCAGLTDCRWCNRVAGAKIMDDLTTRALRPICSAVGVKMRPYIDGPAVLALTAP